MYEFLFMFSHTYPSPISVFHITVFVVAHVKQVKVHVDTELNWTGEDPTKSFELLKHIGEARFLSMCCVIMYFHLFLYL